MNRYYRKVASELYNLPPSKVTRLMINRVRNQILSGTYLHTTSVELNYLRTERVSVELVSNSVGKYLIHKFNDGSSISCKISNDDYNSYLEKL